MILDRFRMTDMVAIVTGAGRGIGQGIAQAFGEAGADVVCAARTAAQIEETAATIRGCGRRALAVPCDVNERAQLEQLVQRTLDEFGRIDVVVNNAGGTMPSPALKTSERMFEESFHFNVTTALVLSQLAIPHMLEKDGGAILNISSGLSHFVEKAFVAYGTSKAALNHMTRMLAYEFAPRIRVNAIAVGSIETDALAPFLAEGDLRAKMEALTPMGRVGTVEDIAYGVLFLASDEASFMTGSELVIDGGQTAQ